MYSHNWVWLSLGNSCSFYIDWVFTYSVNMLGSLCQTCCWKRSRLSSNPVFTFRMYIHQVNDSHLYWHCLSSLEWISNHPSKCSNWLAKGHMRYSGPTWLKRRKMKTLAPPSVLCIGLGMSLWATTNRDESQSGCHILSDQMMLTLHSHQCWEGWEAPWSIPQPSKNTSHWDLKTCELASRKAIEMERADSL